MESLLSLLRTHWDHEPLRLTEARSGPRVCDPQPARFMESSHGFPTAHSDHEPATDRSADSLVREFLGFDSCGHGCPRSVSRFMESPLSFFARIGTMNHPLTRPSATLS